MMAVSAEPLRESAQRALIEAHLAEGNWVEGRRTFEAYRDVLDRELGTQPEPELAALVYRPPNRLPPLKTVTNRTVASAVTAIRAARL